ncbi:MAG: PBECR2 nuclease fold domain-containing protein [Pseudomonadota bacterium]
MGSKPTHDRNREVCRHDRAAASPCERYAKFILPTLSMPYEVWLSVYDDGSYRRRIIVQFTGPRDLMIVARESRDGSLFWNFLHADDRRMNTLRAGALLYAR